MTVQTITAPAAGVRHRNHRAALNDLATHQLELVHQRDLTGHARHQILATVAAYTPGIDPVVRVQQWSSFVAAFEVLRDLDGGFYDTAPVLAYANVESSDPLDLYDRVRVHDEAVDAMADAVDRLFAGRRLVAVAS